MTGNLYFAYGSNMDVDQMAHRELVVLASWGAVLEGYRLVFDFPARSRWLGGAADIVQDPDSRVEGVLHSLANDISIMDPWEGGYRRVPVEVVVLSTGVGETAWTYVVIDKGPPMGPSEVYVEQMLKGAREFDLSPGYVLELEDHLDGARLELGDHVRTARAMARADKPLALEELAATVDLPVVRMEAILSDLGRWGWVQANNEPPVFRIVEGKERASPWVLR
jgi:hypothetical protein